MKKYLFIIAMIVFAFMASGCASAQSAQAGSCCGKASCACEKGACCKEGRCDCKGGCCSKDNCKCAEGKCSAKCNCQQK